MRIKLKDKRERKKLISLIEILLLISLSFTIPIFYSENVNNLSVNNFIYKITHFFNIIPSVSAQGFGGFGNIQQQIGGITEEVTTGQLGCCFDNNEGLCSPNSERNVCEAKDDGRYYNDGLCNINQCALGCCLIGTEAQFITKTRCDKLAVITGLPTNYNSGVTDELACIGLANSQDVGACVILSLDEYEKNSCKFTNKEDCNILGGEFHKDYLCSNTELNTNCEKQNSVSCVDGKDGLYWLDSCGNRENIYDSDKQRSWNNGKVLSESESCSPTSSNSRSSSCGNCAYDRGSICASFRPGTDKGNMQGFTCRDLNCKDGLKTRKNGDSWCLYDGMVGNGRDVVGSRHFRRLCINGELKTEPCADYRKEICVKEGGIGDTFQDMTGSLGISMPDLSSIPGLSGLGDLLGGFGGGLGLSPEENITNETNNKTVNQGSGPDNTGGSLGEITGTTQKALCRPNMWENCFSSNAMTCSKNPDCKTKFVYVDTSFWFIKCVPKYPPGYDLSSSGGGLGGLGGLGGGALQSLGGLGDLTGGSGLGGGMLGGGGGLGGLGGGGDACSAGTKTCTVTYKKKCPSGKWECEKNCNCEKMQFTLQMNDACTMLGDCGAKANIAGKVTSQGYSLSKKGKHVKKPPKLIGVDKMYAIFAKGGNLNGMTGGVNGGFYNQVPGLDLTSMMGINLFNGQMDIGMTGGDIGMTGGSGGGGGGGGGSVGGAAIGGAVGAGGTLIIGMGICPVCGVIGAIAGYFLGGALCKEEKSKEEVTFTCKQWQPPSMGDCSFCSKDPAKPCSKYRCESLGKNCKLINENTGQDECVTVDLTQGTPIIKPFEEVLNKTLYQYIDASQNGFKIRDINGECIQAFSPLVFGVKTNIPAICRIDEEAVGFDEMAGGFLEGDIYTENHTTSTYLPSVESIIAGETSSSSEFSNAASNQTIYNYLLDVVGDINLHVKCQSAAGQENEQDYRINFCVKPGPDLTFPVVIATTPANGASVSYNASSWDVGFFINEPVDCHWGISKPGATNLLEIYNSLPNSMSCETRAEFGTLFGYPCNATLPLTQLENKFYILCRDQPWLEENTSRNLGAKDGGVLEYKLKRTGTPLIIESILPNGTIYKGAEPASVELKVETAGGLNSGESICQYTLNENTNFITFANTRSNQHLQTFNLVKGNYFVGVRCADTAGNLVSGNSNFNLELDTQYPYATRVFYSSGNLVVITDESSRCYYRNDSTPQCNFAYEDSTEMSGGDAYIHQASWDEKTTYYIKCKDVWGNSAGSCSLVARPYSVDSY